jgi:hypothetical protein
MKDGHAQSTEGSAEIQRQGTVEFENVRNQPVQIQ